MLSLSGFLTCSARFNRGMAGIIIFGIKVGVNDALRRYGVYRISSGF
jgi:hypothetical protein